MREGGAASKGERVFRRQLCALELRSRPNEWSCSVVLPSGVTQEEVISICEGHCALQTCGSLSGN